MISRKFSSQWCSTLLAAVLAAGGPLSALQLDHVGGKGCLPLTSEQQAHLESHVGKVVHINPNQLGYDRIQTHLQSAGQSATQIPLPKTLPEVVAIQATSAEAVQAMTQSATLPSSVDNSQLPSFPPIGDQGALGACAAFSIGYYQASHEIGLLNGVNNKTSLNGVISPKWVYNLLNLGVDGGLNAQEVYDLLWECGAPSIVSFPYDTNYTQWPSATSIWVNALSNRTAPLTIIPGLGGYGTQNLTAIKQALANGHIVSFSTYIDSWQYVQIPNEPGSSSTPHAGQYAAYWMNGQDGGHEITIVGYDDNLWIDINSNGVVDPGERGAFLVANSWGNEWGNQGFIWVSYDAFLGVSAVARGPSAGRVPVASFSNNSVYFMTPKAPFYTPSLIGEFSLTQSDRQQIGITLGVSAAAGTAPTSTVLLLPLYYQGGDEEFNGTTPTTTPQTITFAADLSDFLTTGLQTPLQNYYLTVQDIFSGRPTVLNSFSLLDRVNNRTVSSTQVPVSIDNAVRTFSLGYSFAADTTPPAVSFSTPANGATLKGTVQVTVAATDNVGVHSVEFDVDSAVYTTVASSPYSFSLDTSKMTNGTHTITAIASDLSGNESTAQITVQVANDLTLPVIAITSPSIGATVSGTIQLAASASDNVAVANVVFYVDAIKVSTDTAAPYTASFDTTSVANGTHQIQAVATDSSNNQSTASLQVQVQNPVAAAGIYLNTGGPVVQFGGASWIKDTPFETGSAGTYMHNISAANPVYDTERYGNMKYTFNVTNGTHQVTLKFAEIAFTAAKKRVFNVSINGKSVISNLDLFAKVGFGVPYDLTFPVNVTNKTITIQFTSVVNNAKVSAIQITPL